MLIGGTVAPFSKEKISDMHIEPVEMYILSVKGKDKAQPYGTFEEVKERAREYMNDEPPPILKIVHSSTSITQTPAREWNSRYDTAQWHELIR